MISFHFLGQEVQDIAPEQNEFHSVTVDAKSLLKFLASYTIATTTIGCKSIYLVRTILG